MKTLELWLIPAIFSCVFWLATSLLWDAEQYAMAIMFGVCALYMSAMGAFVAWDDIKYRKVGE